MRVSARKRISNQPAFSLSVPVFGKTWEISPYHIIQKPYYTIELQNVYGVILFSSIKEIVNHR
jgi:hypothetical protein